MGKVKQYICEPAYIGNYHVIQVEDGEIVRDSIVSVYNLDGFVAALQSMGYEEAYYVPYYERALSRVKKEYDFALEAYEAALKKPVVLKRGEADKYRKIVHLDD